MMKPLTPLQNAISMIGGVLLIVGALLPFAGVMAEYAPYVFTLGALSYGGTQILRRYEGKNTTIVRLRRQEIIGALLLMVSAVLMLVSSFRLLPLQGGEWKVCLSIAVVFELYTAFRLPQELDKEARNNEQKKG
jgi:putative membrane protein